MRWPDFWPERRSTLSDKHMSLEAPDGETLTELGKPLFRALSRIINAPAAAKVVVSHGVAGRVLQALCLGNSPNDTAGFVAPHDAMFS
jgi:broad specificity phosphatase PhoE